MPRRTNGAEASSRTDAEREVDSVEHRTRRRCRRVPRASTRDGVGVEATTTGGNEFPNLLDVADVVRQPQFVDRRVARFDVLNSAEQLRLLTQRFRNGA